MKLWVFDVEHGACALLADDADNYIMIDSGHNASTGWRPGDALAGYGITELKGLIVTNYDEDHVSGIKNLFEKVAVRRIYRNMSVSPEQIRDLKSEDGMGPGIDALVCKVEGFTEKCGFDAMGLVGLRVQTFYNTPAEFDDENNLSCVAIITYAGKKILFGGDMHTEGWRELLTRPDFCVAISDVDVYFASHHGRSNGCCDELFEYFTPDVVVISDKAMGYQSQETTGYYRNKAIGVTFGDADRWVLTTRSDGNFMFQFNPDGTYAVGTFIA